MRAALLAWYDDHQRVLPWRGSGDPYCVWLSEVMLQQTQVAQVIPYYARFLSRFPTLATLAKADLTAVLQVWQGLGYYTRARNLHQTAQQIEVTGWPQTYAGWRALPGVGDYTARAVTAIILNLPLGAVDGNIRRVYSRLTAQPQFTVRQLQLLADIWVDAQRPGDFNQALMDLGSLICTPRQPQCEVCPIQSFCLGYAQGLVAQLPAKKIKPIRPQRHFLVLLVIENDQILLHQRPPSGLLGGLWELPNQEVGDVIALGKNLYGLIPEVALSTIKHNYTHFQAVFHTYTGHFDPETQANYQWVTRSDLINYPMSRGFQKILSDWL